MTKEVVTKTELKGDTSRLCTQIRICKQDNMIGNVLVLFLGNQHKRSPPEVAVHKCRMGNEQEELQVCMKKPGYNLIVITETWWDNSHSYS